MRGILQLKDSQGLDAGPSVWSGRTHALLFLLLTNLLLGCGNFLSMGAEDFVKKDLLIAEQERRQVLEKELIEIQKQNQDLHQRVRHAERARHQALEEQVQGLQKQNQALQQQVHNLERRQASVGRASEEEVARLKLLLLEKDAQIRILTKKLDEAILEVVRTMAKLRSLQSKAEAASNLAEAEIALKLLKSEAEGKGENLDVGQAEQMLTLSSQEFKKENYGGAVYLTTRAKSLIKNEQARSISHKNMPQVEGEILFGQPLMLKTVEKSNIREGPGMNYKVWFALDEGTPLTGQSYKGLWVRVESEDGRQGWIYYDLVGEQ